MDSLSQIVLGASVAELTLGKKIGNKAVLWGAVIGTIPDLDVIGRYFLDTVDELHFHRGFTHGIVFSVLFAPFLGWLISKIHKKENVLVREWSLMVFLSLVTHPLLDCFTTWGTQLFWPFDYRVAWHSVFVIDPCYTLPFMFLLIVAMFYRRTSKIRFRLNAIGLLISTSFLGLTLINQQLMQTAFEKELVRQKIPMQTIEVRPAPLQNILWTANAEVEDGYYIGYRSFLDETEDVSFTYYPKKHHLLTPFLNNKQLQRLLFITKGWYTVKKIDENHYLINDLRFGLVDGIGNQSDRFVFAYEMTVESGGEVSFKKQQYKFGKDVGKAAFEQLWNRILGDK
jgi:inner membrane protein